MSPFDQLSATTLACLEEMIARRLLGDETVLPDDGARRISALYELSKLHAGRPTIVANVGTKRPTRPSMRKLARMPAGRPRTQRPPNVAREESPKSSSAR